MRQVDVGSLVQFRCHIGHRAGIEAIAAQQVPALERASGSLLRLFNERAELCRIMRRRVAADPAAREAWDEALRAAQRRVEALHELLSEHWEQPSEPAAGPTPQELRSVQ
jgi:two-component system chemotaxis response regulator CheB